MFGLNGRSFLSILVGHWAVHYQKYAGKIWRRTKLSPTIDTVSESNADVIGVIEVLEGQEEELLEELGKLGYRYFYFGRGHRTKYSNLCVQEVLCSKFRGIQSKPEVWPVENGLGGGGGFAHVYIPKLKSHFVLVHLGLPSKRYYWEQIIFLQKYLRKLKGSFILFGDFNMSYDELKVYFPKLDLVSGQVKTCSMNPIMKLFYYKDIDHIFVKGFKEEGYGTIKGRSDHKLIYADLK